jgi:hypothetical protein
MKAWYTNSTNSVQVGEVVTLDTANEAEALNVFSTTHPNYSASHIGLQLTFLGTPRLFPNPNFREGREASRTGSDVPSKNSRKAAEPPNGIPFPVKPTSRLATFHGVIAILGFSLGAVFLLISLYHPRYRTHGSAMVSLGFWGLVWWWILNWAAQTRWLQATGLEESRKQSSLLEKLNDK